MEKLAAAARRVDHAQAVAGRLGFAVRDAQTGGASDANTTSGLGVPTLDGLGPVGGDDHAPGEYLELDSIVPRVTLLAALLLATARDGGVATWRPPPAVRRAPPSPSSSRPSRRLVSRSATSCARGCTSRTCPVHGRCWPSTASCSGPSVPRR